MKCDEFESTVLGLARERLMDAGAREVSLAHARICTGCASRLAAERILVAGTRAVVAEMANEAAPARVEAALLAAFKERTLAARESTSLPPAIKSTSWFRISAAVAASILIMASATAILWSYSSSKLDGNQELGILPLPIELPNPSVAPIKPADESTYVHTNSAALVQGQHRFKTRKSNQAEVVTEFYPLMDNEEDLDSSEVSQVVRVELPASALSAAGLQVNPDMSSVTVKADVALGYDGLARAIRFVH